MSESNGETDENEHAAWSTILRASSSPLKLFALTVLIFKSVFAVAAATALGPEEFIYTLHTFLAVVGAFSLIALWSPRSFYAPHELAQLIELGKKNDDQPLFSIASRAIPTAAALIVIAIYAAYQAAR
jgi:hypothetical protein